MKKKEILATAIAGFFAVFAAVFFFLRYASAITSTITSSLTLTDSPPTVSNVVLNNNLGISLIAGATTNVNVTAQVSDNNGCHDLTNGTTTILLYRSGIGSSTCLAEGVGGAVPANCYVANAFTASDTCSGLQTSINTTTTFPVEYYAQATDASSSFPSQNWMGTVIFTDPSSSKGSADSTSATSTNEIASLIAIGASTSSVDYGILAPNVNTGPTNQLVNIENAGNTSDTIQVNGTALISGANIIATSSQHYATSSFTYGGGEQALSDTATTISGIDIAPFLQFPISGAAWTSTQALPYGDYYHTSVVYNGYLYTIGGCATQCPTSTVLYAPINATGSLGAWTSTQALPSGLYGHTSITYNGYLYTIGGLTNGTSTVLYAPINATGSLGAWTSTQALPYGDSQHTSVAYNGYLYTIGGLLSSGLGTSTILYAPINAIGSTYWGLSTVGASGGTYTGTITFTAVFSN